MQPLRTPATITVQHNPTAATVPPDRLTLGEAARIRAAMHHVTYLYPGAAGKLLAQILLDYGEWSYRIDQTALPAQLVDQVLAQAPLQR